MTATVSTATVSDDDLFALRLRRSEADLWGPFDRLYGDRPDHAGARAALLAALQEGHEGRAPDLRRLDLERDLEPDWFLRPQMAGYATYVDRFAGTLAAVPDRLDHLRDLGVSYLHLLPLLKPRPGESDGGYSVMDYRAVNPRLGTMADLEAVTAACRARGMAVCIDFVLNHCAREHEWAERARAGEARYRDLFLSYADRTLPDAYERTLVEVFPETAPGSFTWEPGMGEAGEWVWTTFNAHQWDLNWANPDVFVEMVRVMLFLANRGVDVLRLDAVAFMWKRMGTRCQSEPEVFDILHALRAACRIVAPGVLHLEEAIVSPAELLPYLGRGAHDGRLGDLAYHNSLMVQVWSALATRDARLMAHVLATHFPRRLNGATYLTYLRCHDDIGWAVTDEDAGALALDGWDHRRFLADFYAGRFEGSFARGGDFGLNPETGDLRTVGTTAALAGLEAAADPFAVHDAVERILCAHALIAAWPGIPTLWMGDEVALPNDPLYADDPGRAADSRWLHRPAMDWDRVGRALAEPGTPEGRVYWGLRHVLARRAATPELHGAVPVDVLDPGAAPVFAFRRDAPTGALVCLFNLSETPQAVPTDWVRAQGATRLRDVLSDARVGGDGEVRLAPYGRLWIR